MRDKLVISLLRLFQTHPSTAERIARLEVEVAAGISLWDAARRGTQRAGRDVISFGGKVGGLLNATFGNVPELIGAWP